MASEGLSFTHFLISFLVPEPQEFTRLITLISTDHVYELDYGKLMKIRKML